MMTAEQLKNSILQLAMQGKLVEQRPKEGTGEELYTKITLEKKQLIKKGTVKKEKQIDPPLDDEVPYDIPDSWVWSRFGDITYNRDSERIPLSISQRATLKKKYDYYGASGVIDKVDQYLFAKPLLLIGEDGANLLNRSTPIAFIAKGKYWVNNHAHVLDMSDNLDMVFVSYYINSISLAKYVTGTAQPKMNQAKMNSIWVPIPPLAEQKRIVAKIEELMPFVDQYAAASTKLNTLNTTFPDMMKKSILQEAVQGKLVPQDQNDEPASVLLKKIAEEKKRLIKEGKFKRDKKESVIFRGEDGQFYENKGKSITCIQDQIPFDIPPSWEWIRLRNYGQFSSGKTPSMSNPKNWIGNIPWVSPKDMKTDIILDSQMHISKEACLDMTLYPSGTLLMVVRSGILKRKLPLCILGVDSTINQDLKAFSFYNNELSEWIYYELKGFEHYILHNLVKNVTTVDSLKFDEFQDLLVPLPPRNEQLRIIKRIKEIMKNIDVLP